MHLLWRQYFFKASGDVPSKNDFLLNVVQNNGVYVSPQQRSAKKLAGKKEKKNPTTNANRGSGAAGGTGTTSKGGKDTTVSAIKISGTGSTHVLEVDIDTTGKTTHISSHRQERTVARNHDSEGNSNESISTGYGKPRVFEKCSKRKVKINRRKHKVEAI